MVRKRIFWSFCECCGEDHIDVFKRKLGLIEICCDGDDGVTTIMLSKDRALKLAQAIIDCYKLYQELQYIISIFKEI